MNVTSAGLNIVMAQNLFDIKNRRSAFKQILSICAGAPIGACQWVDIVQSNLCVKGKYAFASLAVQY